MNVGFTGTQEGLNEKQLKQLRWQLEEILREDVDRRPENFKFHHGDCIGADKQFHDMVKELGGYVVLHPPTNSSKRAFCKADEERPPKPYISRNHEIVDECPWMIAGPKGPEEVRSGTWATIRYAKRGAGFPRTIIMLERD